MHGPTLIGKRVTLCGCLLTVTAVRGSECVLVCQHGSIYHVFTSIVAAAAPVYSRSDFPSF